ncbi:histidine--tRNA ligase [candidate division LCP-89 bacterium B3_LCP]|uniref:Histidine--tRNA ligase n=1 Tax=candidate division LCP-89 bacterium B3_LCP TaxID=2012998 RepID=A0A532V2Y0_UNCL8|nr:MAG: histidine--tRNA ligase [candidate division LCP-89 bacterium B3_LCP]
MATKIKISNASGTRDFLPDEMILRKHVRAIIEEVFTNFGFQPLETPALERLEVLSGKYGKEADRLIFKILKRGESLKSGMESGELCDLGLRYDLTVPLARVIAMNRGQLVFPFKRYQIQPVWRAERPQKGRYREFIQCDADIVGTGSISADAEIIALTDSILKRLKIPGYRIHLNHRLLLQAVTQNAGIPGERFNEACISIDKLDKIGWDGVRGELEDRQFNNDMIIRLFEILQIEGKPGFILKEIEKILSTSPDGQKGITEVKQLFDDLAAFGVAEDHLSFDLYLARGLDYYTGPIFETLVEKPKIGSITGGGRYDGLIGMFSGEPIPASGTTIGIERIIEVIKELQLFKSDSRSDTKVLVTMFSPDTRAESFKIAAELRAAGVPSDVFLDGGKKIGKQFSNADRRGIPVVIVAGPEEIDRGEVTLKDLLSGEQKIIPRTKLVKEVKSLLQ